MKRLLGIVMASMLIVSCTCMFASATGGSLDDIINQSTQQPVASAEPTPAQGSGRTQQEKNEDYISGLRDAANLSPNVEGMEPARDAIKTGASYIVQFLSYLITAGLAVKIMLDLAYITLPPLRTILANGYTGVPQNGGGMGQQGMGQQGMGMGGMGMGMGGMGMGGGYGMNRGMGMGGMGMGGMGMGGMGQPGMGQQGMGANPNSQNTMMGRIQWVSDAALNAVASAGSVGPNGKSMSPFRVYIKDMVVVLVLTPILIVLAATGVLADLGFLIAGALVDAIRSLGSMI